MPKTMGLFDGVLLSLCNLPNFIQRSKCLGFIFWMGDLKPRCRSLLGGWHRRLSIKVFICVMPRFSAESKDSWISGVATSSLNTFSYLVSMSRRKPCCCTTWTNFVHWYLLILDVRSSVCSCNWIDSFYAYKNYLGHLLEISLWVYRSHLGSCRVIILLWLVWCCLQTGGC